MRLEQDLVSEVKILAQHSLDVLLPISGLSACTQTITCNLFFFFFFFPFFFFFNAVVFNFEELRAWGLEAILNDCF